MIKSYALLPRRPDVTPEFYHEHWRTVHADHAKKITTLRQYVQSHRTDYVAAGLEPSPFEGTAEVWYDDLQIAVDMADDPNYTENAQPDEPNFIDMSRITFIMTDETEFVPGPKVEVDTPGIKLLLYVKRRTDISLGRFQAEWIDLASGLLTGADGLRRATGALVMADTYGDVKRSDEINDEPVYDGVAEFTWDDLDAFERDWSEHGESVLAAVATLADLDQSNGDLVEENRVIWP